MGVDAKSVSGRNEAVFAQSSDFDRRVAYMADLNEQAQNRYRLIVEQVAFAEDMAEGLKRPVAMEVDQSSSKCVGTKA